MNWLLRPAAAFFSPFRRLFDSLFYQPGFLCGRGCCGSSSVRRSGWARCCRRVRLHAVLLSFFSVSSTMMVAPLGMRYQPHSGPWSNTRQCLRVTSSFLVCYQGSRVESYCAATSSFRHMMLSYTSTRSGSNGSPIEITLPVGCSGPCASLVTRTGLRGTRSPTCFSAVSTSSGRTDGVDMSDDHVEYDTLRPHLGSAPGPVMALLG